MNDSPIAGSNSKPGRLGWQPQTEIFARDGSIRIVQDDDEHHEIIIAPDNLERVIELLRKAAQEVDRG